MNDNQLSEKLLVIDGNYIYLFQIVYLKTG